MSENVRMAGAPSGLKYPDGIPTIVERIGAQGEMLVTNLHGKLYEQADRDMLFGASSQADTTTTIGLATTYTGLCLSNPAGNTKKFALRQVGVSLCVAPAAVSSIGLGGGYAAAGIATHTTPLIPYPTKLSGAAVASTALADGACTLAAGAGAGLLRVIMPTIGGFTAAALFPHFGVIDMEGAIVIHPGGFVFIYTLTVVHGFFGFTWEELPL